jgi:hypothetical protein
MANLWLKLDSIPMLCTDEECFKRHLRERVRLQGRLVRLKRKFAVHDGKRLAGSSSLRIMARISSRRSRGQESGILWLGFVERNIRFRQFAGAVQEYRVFELSHSNGRTLQQN